MKLDRSKPYGTVHGDPRAHYEQGGHLFDHNGEAIDVPEEAAEKPQRGRPRKATDDQLASQLDD